MSRLGRWIDFENDYKTMDVTYMESVWWVFKQLWEKGLVYRGFKVMPYSTGCTTPLSNFESNLDYRDVNDPSGALFLFFSRRSILIRHSDYSDLVYVAFPLVDEPETHLLAWTTTPWTLPSNLALCVNPSMVYVKVKGITCFTPMLLILF